MKSVRAARSLAYPIMITMALLHIGSASAASGTVVASVADAIAVPPPTPNQVVEERQPVNDGVEIGSGLSEPQMQYHTRSRASVYFERDSIDLSEGALVTIAENVEKLKANPRLAVTLVGFAEDHRSSSYSIALAQRRTSAVADKMVAMGIRTQQIRSTSYGQEQDDVLPCQTESCRVSYRRVEFRYMSLHSAK